MLAYLPMDEKSLGNSNFEAYLINDSNYWLYFTYLSAQGRSWAVRADGILEPNSKMFLEEFGREELNDMEHVCVQLLPFKEKKPFALIRQWNYAYCSTVAAIFTRACPTVWQTYFILVNVQDASVEYKLTFKH